jgi:hypothetical protein
VTAQPEISARTRLHTVRLRPHMPVMRQSAYAFSVCLCLCLPAAAQEPGDAPGDIGQGFGLLEEGARLMLRGLMAEVGPMLDGLEGAFSDLSAYHAPEILPNGDIILRRKLPLVPEEPGTPPGEDIDI